RRLRCDVADRQAGRAAGEPAVGDQRAGPAQALALEEAGRVQHLLHAGTAAGALVPDDHYVTRLDLAAEDARHRRLLALEPDRRAGEPQQLRRDARGLHDRAVWRQVAVQDGEPAVRGVGVTEIPDAAADPVGVQRGPAGALRVRPGGADPAGRGVEQL